MKPNFGYCNVLPGRLIYSMRPARNARMNSMQKSSLPAIMMAALSAPYSSLSVGSIIAESRPRGMQVQKRAAGRPWTHW